MPVYKIDLLGNPNSCLVKIGKQVFRSLVDSGAEASLIHRRAYQNLIAILCNHFTFYIGGSARVVSDFSQTFSVCVLSHKNM